MLGSRTLPAGRGGSDRESAEKGKRKRICASLCVLRSFRSSVAVVGEINDPTLRGIKRIELVIRRNLFALRRCAKSGREILGK